MTRTHSVFNRQLIEMPARKRGMKAFFCNNGLSLTVFAMFSIFMVGQIFTGLHQYNEEQAEHSRQPVALAEYLSGGHFIEATAENAESEFLQMAFYVWLTSILFQKGSAESKKMDEVVEADRDPLRSKHDPRAPWPVRKGGWVLGVYQYSLTLAFVLLFLICFGVHAIGGARAYSDEQLVHGGQAVTVTEYLTTSQFWFESFQNWQSEFLALGAMAILSIFLRHRGSPESKPVDAPHEETGS